MARTKNPLALTEAELEYIDDNVVEKYLSQNHEDRATTREALAKEFLAKRGHDDPNGYAQGFLAQVSTPAHTRIGPASDDRTLQANRYVD